MVRKLSVIVIVLCAAGTASAAVTVTFQEGVNGYMGTLDTLFAAGDPFFPMGEDESFNIDEDGIAGLPTQGALRFDNIRGSGAGQIPTTPVTIGYAELQIFDHDSSNGPIRFHRVLNAPGSDWNEDSTWDSLGGDAFGSPGDEFKPIKPDGVEALATEDFVVPNPAQVNAFKTMDATAALKAWVETGAVNRGWAIMQTTTGGYDFYTSERSDETQRPKLTVVYYQPGLLADLDGNAAVNLADYQTLLNNMGIHLDGPILPGASGDLNFDRKVDPADFGVFKTEFPGGAGAFEAALAGVPEPSTAVLVLLAVCGLVGRRQKRS
jgi:hypothetical protein